MKFQKDGVIDLEASDESEDSSLNSEAGSGIDSSFEVIDSPHL